MVPPANGVDYRIHNGYLYLSPIAVEPEKIAAPPITKPVLVEWEQPEDIPSEWEASLKLGGAVLARRAPKLPQS